MKTHTVEVNSHIFIVKRYTTWTVSWCSYSPPCVRPPWSPLAASAPPPMHLAQKAVATRGKRDVCFQGNMHRRGGAARKIGAKNGGFHGASRGPRAGRVATCSQPNGRANSLQPFHNPGHASHWVRWKLLYGFLRRPSGEPRARECPPPTSFSGRLAYPSRSGLVREGRGPQSTDDKQLATMPLEGMRRSSQTRATQVDGRHRSLGRFVWAEPGRGCTTPLLESRNGWRARARAPPSLPYTRHGMDWEYDRPPRLDVGDGGLVTSSARARTTPAIPSRVLQAALFLARYNVEESGGKSTGCIGNYPPHVLTPPSPVTAGSPLRVCDCLQQSGLRPRMGAPIRCSSTAPPPQQLARARSTAHCTTCPPEGQPPPGKECPPTFLSAGYVDT